MTEELLKVNDGTFGGQRTKNRRKSTMEQLDPPKVNDGTFGGQQTKDRRTTLTGGTTKTAHDGALRPNSDEEQELLMRRLLGDCPEQPWNGRMEWTDGELLVDDGEVKFTSLSDFELN